MTGFKVLVNEFSQISNTLSVFKNGKMMLTNKMRDVVILTKNEQIKLNIKQ